MKNIPSSGKRQDSFAGLKETRELEKFVNILSFFCVSITVIHSVAFVTEICYTLQEKQSLTIRV